jgi:alpha-beta hydrolase superfamily lysophospholipase
MRAKRQLSFGVGVAALCLIVLFINIGHPSDVGQSRFFKDQTYHYETLRVLSSEPYGGADTSEVLETVKHIKSGDVESWYNAWNATAERTLALAQRTRDARSGGGSLLRAHNYFRTAEFLLRPSDPRRSIARQKNLSAFYKGLDTLGVKYERVYAPYGDGFRLPMIYYPAEAQNHKRMLLVFHGGYDAGLEELYFDLVKDAHDHGYDILTFSGPGQGEVLIDQKLTFTPLWEKPTSAVMDTFLAHHERPDKIVLVGESMGGYLAPRAAAFDNRFDGVVAFDAFYDVGTSARKLIPKQFFWLRDHGMMGLVDAVINAKASGDPGTRWATDNAMWTLGKQHPLDAIDEFQKYSLAGVAQRIHGDVLLMAGTGDHFVPLEQVKQMQEALTSARSVTTKIYDRESGGAEHCQAGASTLWHADLFDWLSEKFERQR